MKNRKEDIIFVAVLVILVLIFVIFKVVKGRKVEAPSLEENTQVTDTLNPTNSQPTQKVTVIRKKKSDSLWPELSYTETFVKYQNGRLLQFDPTCQARPINMVLKSGSELMLDNRGNQKVSIVIGDTVHKLDAYGYEVVKLSSETIPATYQVDCGARQNVSTIVLE